MNQPNSALDYYENTRPDVRRHIAGKFERSLDIGCGAGAVSMALKNEGIVGHIEGVELFPAAAALAEQRMEKVYRVDLSRENSPLPANAYDLILCLDVLEHMTDPWAALEKVRSSLKSSGTLVVSLPNVRNFRVLLPLLFKGSWTYADSGLLDRTHLRFFTRKTAIELVEEAGFEIVTVTSPTFSQKGKAWWVNLLTCGIFRELLEFQYFIFARPRK